jgi:hypothetical protein
MKKQIATFCCLMVIQSSVLIAGEPGSTNGPLRRASLSKTAWTGRSVTFSKSGQAQDPAATVAPAPDPDTRSWAERHPVWTGAMVGFSAGFLMTYAVAASDDRHNELLNPIGPGGPALVWGGVGAGIGALAGWGIGRSQHDGYHDRARTVAHSDETNSSSNLRER